jgi:hypothetical protein
MLVQETFLDSKRGLLGISIIRSSLGVDVWDEAKFQLTATIVCTLVFVDDCAKSNPFDRMFNVGMIPSLAQSMCRAVFSMIDGLVGIGSAPQSSTNFKYSPD